MNTTLDGLLNSLFDDSEDVYTARVNNNEVILELFRKGSSTLAPIVWSAEKWNTHFNNREEFPKDHIKNKYPELFI